MTHMTVGERIKAIRQERRLQGKELADRAHISASLISLIEKRSRLPGTETLQEIAKALDVSTGYLLGEEDVDLALPEALASQSFKIFLRRNPGSELDKGYCQVKLFGGALAALYHL